MKKLVYLIMLVALLLAGCSAQEPEPEPILPEVNYTQGIYQLTFKTRKISNDCVGNDWSFTYTYNGQEIKSGFQIYQSLEIFTFQAIEVEIREDDKIDDVGTGTLRVAICDGGSGKVEITVTEKGGKYNGNTAVWEITCEVKEVGRE